MPYHSREIPLRGYTLPLNDVAVIYQRLQAYITEEGARELAALQQPANMTAEQFNAEKERVRTHAYKITVTIHGSDGSSLYEDNVGIFTSPNLPAEISSIFMTNKTAFRSTTGIEPTNTFSLTIDFAKPPLIDANNPVSNPTPNLSLLTIEGNSDAWLATITDRVMGVLKKRKNSREFLHRAFVYDAGLMLFAVPAGLYLCWKSSPTINAHLTPVHGFTSAAAYIYIFFVVVWGYRVLFGYTKWAFPTMEIAEDKAASAQHRRWWYAILVGLLSAFAYDVLRAWWQAG